MPTCRRLRVRQRGRRIAIPGNRRAREIQRAAGGVAGHLHVVRVGEVGDRSIFDRERRDVGARIRGQQLRHLVDDRRRNQRLVALHVHDDVGVGPAARRRDFGDAIACRRHACARSWPPPRRNRARRWRCARRRWRRCTSAAPRGARALVHPLQHGFAGQRQQRLARQARGIEARGNDDAESSFSAPAADRRGRAGARLPRASSARLRGAETPAVRRGTPAPARRAGT